MNTLWLEISLSVRFGYVGSVGGSFQSCCVALLPRSSVMRPSGHRHTVLPPGNSLGPRKITSPSSGEALPT